MRFAIVSEVRTGSELLREYLVNSGLPVCRELVHSDGTYEDGWLEVMLNSEAIKIHRTTLLLDMCEPVRSFLIRERVPVIWLWRRNKVQQYISYARAVKTGKWQGRSPCTNIRISGSAMSAMIRAWCESEEYLIDEYPDRFDITYEWMTGLGGQACLHELGSWLGREVVPRSQCSRSGACHVEFI